MLFYKAVIFKINNTTFHQSNFSGISLYLITSNKVQIGFQLKNFFFFHFQSVYHSGTNNGYLRI